MEGSGICGTKKATSKNDEYYTHRYAIEPILEYINPHSKIWCPFDTEQSNFVTMLSNEKHYVKYSHISTGDDFFETDIKCDYIISNPPYTIKNEVLTRLFELGRPFAMLMNAAGLFDGQYRFNLFKDNEFELLYMNKRVEYFTDFNNPTESTRKSPPNPSVWFCSNMLPQQIVFKEINKE
jgi:hypothetical protein